MGHPGCRLIHVPTGCAVECVHLRTQHQNYQRALILLELLVEA
jgi:protein subunit release factor A